MMANLSAIEVESGAGGTLVYGPGYTQFSSVSIDTRTMRRGALFFAIRGPNQDGHRFIPDAVAKGASGIVTEQAYEFPGELPPEVVLIKTTDTHQALKYLAMYVRRRWQGTLVAVTGSMGKTTTREFAAQVAQGKFRTYQTPGNYNNLFGLPLALIGMPLDDEIGIFEMGMSAPGEIAEMCRIANPVTGIITNVAAVHLEFFKSIEEIARAKAELAESLPANGTLIFNADDPMVCGIAARFGGRKISFGLSRQADIRAGEIEIAGVDKTRFRLLVDGTSFPASVPFAGAHYVMNALPAVALGWQLNILPDQIIARLEQLQPVAMRGQVLRFDEGFTVIDDSYNSNPRALMQMIEVLSKAPSFTRRILVAGEMLELGKDSPALHSECGTFAVDQKVDIIIGIQGAAREIVRAAITAGMSETDAHYFADSNAATAFVNNTVRSGDLLLIKGSRGVHTEKIVQTLRARFRLLES